MTSNREKTHLSLFLGMGKMRAIISNSNRRLYMRVNLGALRKPTIKVVFHRRMRSDCLPFANSMSMKGCWSYKETMIGWWWLLLFYYHYHLGVRRGWLLSRWLWTLYVDFLFVFIISFWALPVINSDLTMRQRRRVRATEGSLRIDDLCHMTGVISWETAVKRRACTNGYIFWQQRTNFLRKNLKESLANNWCHAKFTKKTWNVNRNK